MSIRPLAVFALSAVVALGCTRTEENRSAPGAGSAPTPAADKSNITVKGSDTMVILGQRWAEAYMKANPGITV